MGPRLRPLNSIYPFQQVRIRYTIPYHSLSQNQKDADIVSLISYEGLAGNMYLAKDPRASN